MVNERPLALNSELILLDKVIKIDVLDMIKMYDIVVMIYIFGILFSFSFNLIFAKSVKNDFHRRHLQKNAVDSTVSNTSDSRIYFMKKVNGPGCPYTASWLIHINHFKRVMWYIDITKMEAATFNMLVLKIINLLDSLSCLKLFIDMIKLN